MASKAKTRDRSNGHVTNGTEGDLNGCTVASKKPRLNGDSAAAATNGVLHQNGGSQKSVTNGSAGQGREQTAPVDFLQQLVPILLKEGYQEAMKRENKVCEFVHPEELKATLSCLSITEDGASDEELLQATRDIIRYSVKTSHPRFYNQLFGGLDQYSLGGCWLTDVLNTSQYTFEVAPVFALMESEVYRKMLGSIGFDGGEAIFTPGGSMANMYAVNLGRYRKCPEIKTKGLQSLSKPLCLFTSEKSHYSLKKAAAVLGLGTDSVIAVKTDSKGKMIPQDLKLKIEEAISEGKEPFLVNATAGTTVFGAYDPLNELADISEQFGLWLHVDGAWGGSVALSRKYKHLISGIERCDSMTWNPHKLMGAPQQCAMFLTRHPRLLMDCNSANAHYLFQQDKFYDVSYDTGDRSLQCGRKVDVLKLWMMWKNKGDNLMEAAIDGLFTCSRYLAEKLKVTPGFRLLLEPECTNVCFWYIPPSLRGQQESPDWWSRLSKVAPKIKERMVKQGSMMIGYNPDGQHVNFFRMIVSNFDTNTSDMDFLVEEITRIGQDL